MGARHNDAVSCDPSPMEGHLMRIFAASAIAVCLTLTACGGTGTAKPTVTVTAQSPGAPTSAASSATSKPAATKIAVPAVVGKNHQEAQNIMQAAGLYMLAEKDATGQGRMLILDRNWQVVRQTPKAGTKVSPDTTITLYSKKIGE